MGKTLSLKVTTVFLLLAIAFLLAPLFQQNADAGWWACAKATAKCAAGASALIACQASVIVCIIASAAAAAACKKAARECS